MQEFEQIKCNLRVGLTVSFGDGGILRYRNRHFLPKSCFRKQSRHLHFAICGTI